MVDERGAAPRTLDRASVRRAFERAASTYDAAAVLQREVGRRMEERLGVVRVAPSTILDAGCGTGAMLPALQARYPQARLVGLDLAQAMTAAAARRRFTAGGVRALPQRVLRALVDSRRPRRWLVCGDVCRLPIRSRVIDLVWSNLTLQWIDDLPAALAEFSRVLEVGGLVSFTTLGPDTLKELRQAFAAADDAVHTSRFVDMHDIGDMLLQAGFADPVMDMEMITMTYGDPLALMRDLKSLGAQNARLERRRGLTGRDRWQRMLAAFEGFRRDGRLPATFEVVYGHAWKGEPRFADDGRAIVRLERQPAARAATKR